MNRNMLKSQADLVSHVVKHCNEIIDIIIVSHCIEMTDIISVISLYRKVQACTQHYQEPEDYVTQLFLSE